MRLQVRISVLLSITSFDYSGARHTGQAALPYRKIHIFETVKAENLKPYDYFEYLLIETPEFLAERD